MTLGSVVRADDFFGSLSPERFGEVKKPVVKSGGAVYWLLNEFERVINESKRRILFGFDCVDVFNKSSLEGFCAADIESVSLKLKIFENYQNFGDISGVFLSRLIKFSHDEKVCVHTQHLSIVPSFLGYKNSQELIVKGNVAENVGHSMGDGVINVLGCCGNRAGYLMNGGELSVSGNAGGRVGENMIGGSMVIGGNAHDFVGYGMCGGIIRIKGNISHYGGSNMNGGTLVIEGNAGKCLGGGRGDIFIDGNYEPLDLGITTGNILHRGGFIVKKGSWVV